MSSNGHDPFAIHGLEHLSPSSCNLWQAQPAMWVMQYLLGRRQHVGAAAHRGTAVEAGVVRALTRGVVIAGVPVAGVEPRDHALAEFDRLTALSGDSRRDWERKAISGMVDQAFGELAAYGPPVAVQQRVELAVAGLAVPLIGFYDFLWDGVLLDLKTLHALPSSVRTSHARQVAFYCAAGGFSNYDPRVTYVTAKKSVTYRVDEGRAHVEALQRIALSIQRFLSLSSDAHYLASLLSPDFDSFYWSDPQTRQDGFEIWKY